MEFYINEKKRMEIRNQVDNSLKSTKFLNAIRNIIHTLIIITAVVLTFILIFSFLMEPNQKMKVMRWSIGIVAVIFIPILCAGVGIKLWSISDIIANNPMRANETLTMKDNTLFYSYTMYNPKGEEDSRILIVMKLRDVQQIIYNKKTEELTFQGDFFGHFFEHISDETPCKAGKLEKLIIKDWFSNSLREAMEKKNMNIEYMENTKQAA